MVESEYSAAEKITGISKGNRAIDESNPAPKVTVQHVLAATAAMLGSPTILRIRELQMQARLVLCTIVVMAKAKMVNMTLGNV